MDVHALPMTTRFRGITVREGLLLSGPAGWGEFCPFPEYDDREAVAWLAAAREAAEVGWPEPVRDRVPVNCTVLVRRPLTWVSCWCPQEDTNRMVLRRRGRVLDRQLISFR